MVLIHILWCTLLLRMLLDLCLFPRLGTRAIPVHTSVIAHRATFQARDGPETPFAWAGELTSKYHA